MGKGATMTDVKEEKQAALHIKTDPAQKPWQVTSGIEMDSSVWVTNTHENGRGEDGEKGR